MRDGFGDGSVGGKRKAVDDLDGVESEGGLRETRRMRARRIAQNGEMVQSSVTVGEDRAGTLEFDDSRSQGMGMVSCWLVGLHGD